MYGYGSGTVGGANIFVVTAIFENANGGNTGSLTGYTGYNITINPSSTLVKGSGSGYALTN